MPDEVVARDGGPTDGRSTRSQGKGSSLGHKLVLGGVVLVCVSAVCAAAYYQSEISGALRVRPWDTAAPREAVQRFVSAIAAGDSAAAGAVAPGIVVEVDEEGAVRVRPPSASPQMAPAPVARYMPSAPLDDAPVTYVYRMGLAKVTYANAQGQSVVVGLKNDGEMKVVSITIE